MNDLHRAVVRFKAQWVDCFPTNPVPTNADNIVTWYKQNNHAYKTLRYIPGTGYVLQSGERLTDDLGSMQWRLNALINEGSIIEILTRPVETSSNYW